jgi:hypothetical protein
MTCSDSPADRVMYADLPRLAPWRSAACGTTRAYVRARGVVEVASATLGGNHVCDVNE